MRRMSYALLAVVAAIALGMSAAPAQAAKTVVIDAVDTPASVFQPANVTVEVGDTVRWEFDQALVAHHGDLGRGAVLHHVEQRNDRAGGEVDVVEDAAGLVDHVAERHREGLEVRRQSLHLGYREGSKQVVL